jgi:hypothetical protein
MWWRNFGRPVSGRKVMEPQISSLAEALAAERPAPAGETGSGLEAAVGDFDRMVKLLRSNEQLFGKLEDVSRRLDEVRSYLAEDDCNVTLARECHRYWRTRHSGVLTQLRANRVEARRLLRRLDAGACERSFLAGGFRQWT